MLFRSLIELDTTTQTAYSFKGVYPNPIINSGILEIPNAQLNEYTLSIYDPIGKLIRTQENILNDKIIIDEAENMTKETIPAAYNNIQSMIQVLELEKNTLTK